MTEFEYIVKDEDDKQRLDVALTQALQSVDSYSRSKIGKFIGSGCVRVNDEIILKTAYKLDAGDIVFVALPSSENSQLDPDANVKLNIVFEDEHVLVLNKDAGVIAHPGTGGETQTLAHGLLAYLGESILSIGHPLRPGIVHRLDKDTSGLMVVAKTSLAYKRLTEQFLPPRTVKRTYLALTLKLPNTSAKAQEHQGTINLPISRHPHQRTKMTALQASGKAATTHWRVQQFYERGFLLELELETGRTHQIRAHLEALKSPIIGDTLYGYKIPEQSPLAMTNYLQKFNRVALHAWRLNFRHPAEQQELSFEACLPDDMAMVIPLLG